MMNSSLLKVLLPILSWLNLIPQPLLDTTEPQTKAHIIIAAVRLGLFDVIATGATTYAAIATAVGAQGDHLRLILEALVGYGYLREQGGRYTNSRMAQKFLVSTSPQSVAQMVAFQADTGAFTLALETLVRTGTPAQSYQRTLDSDPSYWQRYVLSMRDGARLSTQEVVQKVTLPTTARRLLDLGGGHGVHAASFCRRYPELAAVVFDHPEAIAIARKHFAQTDLSGRLEFRAGNFWHDDLNGPYDVVLLFSIVHLFAPDRNQSLLRRIADHTPSGGMIVVADFLANRLPQAWLANFSLGMRALFGEGQTYSEATINEWLHQAGFLPTTTHHLRNPASLIIAKRQ